jgi:hypothetical protein
MAIVNKVLYLTKISSQLGLLAYFLQKQFGMKAKLLLIFLFSPLHLASAGQFGDIPKVCKGKAIKEAADTLLKHYIPELRVYLTDLEEQLEEYFSGEVKIEFGERVEEIKITGKTEEKDIATVGWEFLGDIRNNAVSPIFNIHAEFSSFKLSLKNAFYINGKDHFLRTDFVFRFEF